MQLQTETLPGHRSFETGLWILSAALVIGLGLERYLEDGSFFFDEAFVALSLRDSNPLDLFGPIGLGHSFPRFYLIVIQGLTGVLGYETWVVRALPFACFALATGLWFKLLFRRLAAFPVLMILALFLNLLPVTWLEYSSAFKQYSFDVLVALLPFWLSDEKLQACFRDGRGRWMVWALALPCALSYTYGISLLGRLAGWYGFSLRNRQPRLDPVSTSLMATGVMAASIILYLTDIQFMDDSVYSFWAGSILGQEGNSSLELIRRLITGPYSGAWEIGQPPGVAPLFLDFMTMVFGLGIMAICMCGSNSAYNKAPKGWGSRSLGAVAALVGLLLASWFIQYPITRRLTLFMLPMLQIILFEGFCMIHGLIASLRWGARVSTAVGVLWIVAIAPAAIESSTRFVSRESPHNIRSVFDTFESSKALPIYTMPLLVPSLLSTPHELEPSRFIKGPAIHEIPWGEEIFVIDTHEGQVSYTNNNPSFRYREVALSMEKLQGEVDELYLYRVVFPEKTQNETRETTSDSDSPHSRPYPEPAATR